MNLMRSYTASSRTPAFLAGGGISGRTTVEGIFAMRLRTGFPLA